MGIHTDYDNAATSIRDADKDIDMLYELIELLEEIEDKDMELWDVPNCSEIEDVGGDPDDTVSEALEKANGRILELEDNVYSLNIIADGYESRY